MRKDLHCRINRNRWQKEKILKSTKSIEKASEWEPKKSSNYIYISIKLYFWNLKQILKNLNYAHQDIDFVSTTICRISFLV